MDPSERSKLHKEQTDDIYRAIGRFTVRFELLFFDIRQAITFFLLQSGLINHNLPKILLADLTAYPLKSLFGSMIPEIVQLTDNEKKIIKLILKRVQLLIEKRNEIVHSTWFVGFAKPEDIDFSETSGHKLTKEKTGAGVKLFKYNSEKFDSLAAECDAVAVLVKRLWSVIHGGRSIEKNFIITNDGQVVVPNKKKGSS